jgi:hypothetical protein
VHCVVAGKYPQLDACFDPSSRVTRARVYFRAGGAPDWYYVEMKPEAACFRGTPPRPKKSLSRLSYYVAVTDQDFAEARTEEYGTTVVADEKGSSEGIVAPFVTTASVVVGGAAALPAGPPRRARRLRLREGSGLELARPASCGGQRFSPTVEIHREYF